MPVPSLHLIGEVPEKLNVESFEQTLRATELCQFRCEIMAVLGEKYGKIWEKYGKNMGNVGQNR